MAKAIVRCQAMPSQILAVDGAREEPGAVEVHTQEHENQVYLHKLS